MSKLFLESHLLIPTNRIDKSLVYEYGYIKISNGVIIVKKGFSWDGCTWARDGKKRWDGKPITSDASCVHDALLFCLYSDPNFPLTKKQVDKIFRDELFICKYKFLRFIPVFITAYSYYIGVHYLNRIPDFFKKGKK